MINDLMTISPFEWLAQLRIFGIQVIAPSDVVSLILRFMFNTLVLYLMIRHLYARNSRRRDFYFSYFAVGITVFVLCFLLESVKLELGFALGLFAIFGIIRYRTDAIPTKEMTYLFVVIGISVMNALANDLISYAELVLSNAFVLAILYWLEKYLKLRHETSLNILYEKIENINKNKESQLIDDLKARTGISIKRYEIVKIDFLRDVAEIVIYYDTKQHETLIE